MAWTLYKEVKYAADAIPNSDLTDFPVPVWITADADIAAELGSGGGIKFTSADGLTDLDFGLYPTSNLAAGTVHARVKISPDADVSIGDTAMRLYYSATESTTEDKPGTVSNGHLLFAPMEEDPSGGAVGTVRDWVTNTLLGVPDGTFASGDLTAATVANGIECDSTNFLIFGTLGGALEGASESTIEFIGIRGSVISQAFGRDHALFAGDGSRRFGIYPFLDSNVYFAVDDGTNQAGHVIAFGGTGAHHYAQVFDGSQTGLDRLTAYIDGVAQAKNGALGSTIPATLPTDSTAQVYANRVNGGVAGGGIYDECRVHSSARSADWIEYSYTADFNKSDLWTLGAEQGGGGGSFTGTAGLAFAPLAIAASGSVEDPVDTATAALTLPALAIDAAATSADPSFDAAAALALPTLAMAAAGSVADPVDTAAGALTLAPITIDADAAFAGVLRTGSGSLALAAVQITSTGMTDPPVFEATGALTLAPVTIAAAAAFDLSLSAGTATLTLPAVQFSGTATFLSATPSLGVIVRRDLRTWNRTVRRDPRTWNRTVRYTAMPSALTQTVVWKVSEDRDMIFDFSKAPELTEEGLTIADAEKSGFAGLTTGEPIVTAVQLGDVPAGKGVAVRTSGAVAGQEYSGSVKAILSNGRDVVIGVRVKGQADDE